MIDLYTWPTPNGHKIHIMLEETGLPYKVIPVDIGAGDQFDPQFLKISPNNKMPAMVDHDGPVVVATSNGRVGFARVDDLFYERQCAICDYFQEIYRFIRRCDAF